MIDDLEAERIHNSYARLSGGNMPLPLGMSRRVRPNLPQLRPMPQTQNGAYRAPSASPAPPPQQSNPFGANLMMAGLALAAMQNQQPNIKWNGPRGDPSQFAEPIHVPEFTPEQLAQLQTESPPGWWARNFGGQGGFGGGGGGPLPPSQQSQMQGLLEPEVTSSGGLGLFDWINRGWGA